MTTEEVERSRAYSIPYAIEEKIGTEIKKILETSIIRKLNSPYASLIVIVKKDYGKRIYADFRKLNMVEIFDPESITTTEIVFK